MYFYKNYVRDLYNNVLVCCVCSVYVFNDVMFFFLLFKYVLIIDGCYCVKSFDCW